MNPKTESETVVLRRAARQAAQAPSVHNTQPWRFNLTEHGLEIHSDPERSLAVLDPRGRQMTISCGCSLFNARVSIAASGYPPMVQRRPEPEHPTLLARVSLGARGTYLPIAELDAAVSDRHTNRRGYVREQVPGSVLERLVRAALAEGVLLIPIATAQQRATALALSRLAEEIENSDPAYRAELRRWTTDDPRRVDGVQAATIPYRDRPRSTDPDALPIRAFDIDAMGWLPTWTRSDVDQCLLLFASAEDDVRSWLRVGEALERVWLELTREGLWASPLTQAVEVRTTHAALRKGLGIDGHPQLLLRVGYAPHVTSSRRRPLQDLLQATGTSGSRTAR